MGKEEWAKYAAESGGGVNDPSRHDIAFLNAFLAVNTVPDEPVVDASHEELANQLKCGQRTDPKFKEAWYAYCSGHGHEKYDPMKHDTAFLEGFLSGYGKAIPGTASRAIGARSTPY